MLHTLALVLPVPFDATRHMLFQCATHVVQGTAQCAFPYHARMIVAMEYTLKAK